MVTIGRLWIGGLLALLGLTHFLVWTTGSCIQVSGDPWMFVRHVQWVAITWQLDSALTEGYIAFSKGFMWFSLQLDPGELVPGPILGDPQWACDYPPLGWYPLPTEWAWRNKPGEDFDLQLKNQKISETSARLLIGTCVASFTLVFIFSLARLIIAQIVLCSRRRRNAKEENAAADVAPVITDVAQEVQADLKDEKKENQDHSDLENAAEKPAIERALPPTNLENQNNECTQELKPPELLDGLKALVDKAQMALQTPFLAVQALLQGPVTPAAAVMSTDVENGGAGEHDAAGELAAGPESGSEAERNSVEGPDGVGAGELGSGEDVSGADAEGEAALARNDSAPTPSAQAQTVHGADFGGGDEQKPNDAAAESDENAEKEETDEEGGVVGAAAYYGGCGSLYAAVASVLPLLAFIFFVVYAVAATVGPSGLLIWRPSSMRLALARLRTVWGGSHLVRRNAVAAVLEAASSQGYWIQRLETELGWSVSELIEPVVKAVLEQSQVHFVLFIRSPEGLAAASSAETMDDFFASARNSLRVYLRKKVGPVFRSSEKVKKDLSEGDLAELIGSWLEVCIAAIWPSLEAHYIQAIRNGRADEPTLPAAAAEAAKALLRVRASQYKAVFRGDGSGLGAGRFRSIFWRYTGRHTLQRHWLAVSLTQTLAMAFLMGALKGRAQLGVQVILHVLMALALVAFVPMRSRGANFKSLVSETLRSFAIFLAALQSQGNSRVRGVGGLATNSAALEATLIVVAVAIAAVESVSPIHGCLRALTALAISICVDPSQLPAAISYADPDRLGFRTPKRILRTSTPGAAKDEQVGAEAEAADAALTARAGAIHKWASVQLMPRLLTAASSSAMSFCLDHVPSDASLEDMCDCDEVEEYLVRAREAFSQQIILAVGGILGGGSAEEHGDDSSQKLEEKTSSYDLERPPPFPPWLGHDGVRCIQAVMQQQVLELIQHMWKVAAEPAVRGQLLAGVAAVSLAPPLADGLPVPASGAIQWDRGLLEQNWGEHASRGFGVTEEELHHLWLSKKTQSGARFTKEHILRWLRENAASNISGDPAVASGTPAVPGAGEGNRGVWC